MAEVFGRYSVLEQHRRHLLRRVLHTEHIGHLIIPGVFQACGEGMNGMQVRAESPTGSSVGEKRKKPPRPVSSVSGREPAGRGNKSMIRLEVSPG